MAWLWTAPVSAVAGRGIGAADAAVLIMAPITTAVPSARQHLIIVLFPLTVWQLRFSLLVRVHAPTPHGAFRRCSRAQLFPHHTLRRRAAGRAAGIPVSQCLADAHPAATVPDWPARRQVAAALAYSPLRLSGGHLWDC